ncbi:MAG: hypothetical protein QG657_1994 [Acidobacteriota bacterium]|nr:hypothetical protein [Acidobacteriota bacterium]
MSFKKAECKDKKLGNIVEGAVKLSSEGRMSRGGTSSMKISRGGTPSSPRAPLCEGFLFVGLYRRFPYKRRQALNRCANVEMKPGEQDRQEKNEALPILLSGRFCKQAIW